MVVGVVQTWLDITVLPKVMVAIINQDKKVVAVTFLWGVSAYASLNGLRSATQYFGELLALDWRKALTRKVPLLCVCACACGCLSLYLRLCLCYDIVFNIVRALLPAGSRGVFQWQVHVLVEPGGQAH